MKEWLAKKGFNENIQENFKGISGTELFDIKKEELEKACGKVEGKRLYSQLNIQKSISGVSYTKLFIYMRIFLELIAKLGTVLRTFLKLF